jgi:Holliday junction resolvase RusA-like endonuclease
MIQIRIYGNPAPQGSKTAVVRGGKAIMFEASKKLPAWREAILMTSRVASMEHGGPLLGPLKVSIWFYLERPRSTVRDYPNTAPDIDKLVRAVFDGLQESDMISNDGQIVELKTWKFWADENQPVGALVHLEKKV